MPHESLEINEIERRPLHLMLVEDNHDHAELIRRACARTSIPNDVEHVDDPRKALAYLKGEIPGRDRSTPDIILLDLNLPGLSGHEVLEEIRAAACWQSLPVIILSTSNNQEDVKRAYQAHASSYVKKPERFDDLCTLVNDLLKYWGSWNIPSISSTR